MPGDIPRVYLRCCRDNETRAEIFFFNQRNFNLESNVKSYSSYSYFERRVVKKQSIGKANVHRERGKKVRRGKDVFGARSLLFLLDLWWVKKSHLPP